MMPSFDISQSEAPLLRARQLTLFPLKRFKCHEERSTYQAMAHVKLWHHITSAQADCLQHFHPRPPFSAWQEGGPERLAMAGRREVLKQ